MDYDIIGQCSILSAAALRRPRCGSGLAATLPRLCRPGPALAEPLGPDPLRIGDAVLDVRSWASSKVSDPFASPPSISASSSISMSVREP